MAIEIVSSLIKNGDFPYKSPFSYGFFHGFPIVFSLFTRPGILHMGILPALESPGSVRPPRPC